MRPPGFQLHTDQSQKGTSKRSTPALPACCSSTAEAGGATEDKSVTAEPQHTTRREDERWGQGSHLTAETHRQAKDIFVMGLTGHHNQKQGARGSVTQADSEYPSQGHKDH